MKILNNPKKTLINGEEIPFPGGSANGDGNASPDIPFTKCGMALVKKNPVKNTLTKWYHFVEFSNSLSIFSTKNALF